jgi:hypothetical protein
VIDEEEGGTTVATKRSKRSGTKAIAKGSSSKAARPAATPTKPAVKAARPTAPRREAAGRVPSFAERALSLRDAIQQSKLTAADPWGYTVKARKWEARAERLVAGAETAEAREALATLAAELEGDRDFREARRLF